MFVNVLVYLRTPQGDQQAQVESFSRVPNIGERIQVSISPNEFFRVIDVTHITARCLSQNDPVANILVQP